MSKLIKYRIDFQNIYKGQQVESNCNEIGFKNLGTATVMVGSVPLLSNQSFTVNGNLGEIDITVYNIQFQGGTKNLLITRKMYVDEV